MAGPLPPGMAAPPTPTAQMPQLGPRKQKIASGQLAGPLGPGHGPNQGMRPPTMPGPGAPMMPGASAQMGAPQPPGIGQQPQMGAQMGMKPPAPTPGVMPPAAPGLGAAPGMATQFGAPGKRPRTAAKQAQAIGG